MRTFLRIVGAALMAVLLFLMLGPNQEAEAATRIWDKAAHFIAFGLMLWCLGVLFRRLPRFQAAAAAIAIGGAVELIQGQTGRDASWGDLLADALGVAVALLVWAIWRGFRPREAFQISNTR